MAEPPTQSQTSATPDADFSSDVVHREIDRYLDLWKVADQRTLGTLTPLLTFSLAVLPAAIALASIADTPGYFLLPCIPLSLLLSLCATVVAMRINATAMTKHTYMMFIAVLRQYYVDREPDLRRYLPIPTLERSSITREVFRKYLAQPSIRAALFPMLVVSSSGLGIAGGIVAWWAVPEQSLVWWSAIGAAISAVSVPVVVRVIRAHSGKQLNRLEYWFFDGWPSFIAEARVTLPIGA